MNVLVLVATVICTIITAVLVWECWRLTRQARGHARDAQRAADEAQALAARRLARTRATDRDRAAA